MEPSEERERREGTAAAATGCLIAALATATGFGVWFEGTGGDSGPRFEEPVDVSLLYIELPGMLAGFPLLTLLTWSLARAVLRGRGRRGTRRAVKAAVVVLTLLLLSWACGAWLEYRVETNAAAPCPGVSC